MENRKSCSKFHNYISQKKVQNYRTFKYSENRLSHEELENELNELGSSVKNFSTYMHQCCQQTCTQ